MNAFSISSPCTSQFVEGGDELERRADRLVGSGGRVGGRVVAAFDLRVAAGDEADLVLPLAVDGLRQAEGVLGLDGLDAGVVLLGGG